MLTEVPKIAAPKCRLLNIDGNPCGAWAVIDGHCLLHADPALAAELGRRGGRKNRRRSPRSPEILDAVLVPRSVHELRDFLAEVISGLRAGRIEYKAARALVEVGCLLLEAIKRADEKDAEESAAIWKLESLDRTDEELLFFAKNGYWPEAASLPQEVNTSNER